MKLLAILSKQTGSLFCAKAKDLPYHSIVHSFRFVLYVIPCSSLFLHHRYTKEETLCESFWKQES